MKKDIPLNEKHLKITSQLFSLTSVIIIIVSSALTGFLLFSNSTLFYRLIELLFGRIPYVGNMAYYYVKSMNIVNFNVLFEQAFKPLMMVDILYFFIPLLFFEIIIIIMKRYIMKHDHAFLTALLLIIIQGSILLTVNNNLILTHHIDSSLFELKNTLVRCMFVIQLILSFVLLYRLRNLNRFNLSQLFSHKAAKRLIHSGSIVVVIIFSLLATSLIFANNYVKTVEENLKVDYVINLKPTADGLVHLNVPEKITKPLDMIGVSFPKEINGSMLTDQFGITEIDAGSMINNFVHTKVNLLTYRFLQVPLANASLSIFFLVLIFILEAVTQKVKEHATILYHIQWVLSAIIYFSVSKNFGTVINILSGLVFLGTSIHLIAYWKTNQKLLGFIQTVKDKWKHPKQA